MSSIYKTTNNNTPSSRRAGVLMPVASLPSDCGAGSFGERAYRFVDKLAIMGMKIWQILPLNPLGYGNSPYQPYSSFAGDELYIDIALLEKEGYVTSNRAPFEAIGAGDKIDYEAARAYKEPYLREAYQNFSLRCPEAFAGTGEASARDEEPERSAEASAFAEFQKMDWVYPYAVFVALKKQNQMKCWNEWPGEQQDWILNRQYDISHLEDEIGYQIFLQYQFRKQWLELKRYANDKGIDIMGDIPIYVGIDSLDVWGCRENFLLDAQGKPSFVAGVPPDYFSATGQRWGNPIYDWEHLEQKGFQFWIDRLSYSNQLYDIIRIDHFRAFDTYWKIPASCETAVEGEWVEAPGYALFDTIFAQMPDIRIVAEDLGDLRPEVLKLRDHYDFLGMHVLEFTMPSAKPIEHQLIYTGTHDNQTVRGWYQDCDKKTRGKIRRKLWFCGTPGTSVNYRLLNYMFRSPAELAIAPLMDILELDDRARLNTPGTVGSPNWEWRLADVEAIAPYEERIRKILLRTGRTESAV